MNRDRRCLAIIHHAVNDEAASDERRRSKSLAHGIDSLYETDANRLPNSIKSESEPTFHAGCIQLWAILARPTSRRTTPASWPIPEPEPVRPNGCTPGLFASRHAGAPFLPSCPDAHGIPDSPQPDRRGLGSRIVDAEPEKPQKRQRSPIRNSACSPDRLCSACRIRILNIKTGS